MIQVGNLTNNSGRALLDGAGDHGRCAGSYLTGVQVKKTTVDIKASISCDQIIANKIGHETRFASLELGMDDSRQAGDCDSGYSCAYTNNLAWRSETQPLPPVLDPRVLFERLFGTGVDPEPRRHGSPRALPPQHPGLRHRRHEEAAVVARADRPPQARGVSLVDSRGRAPAGEGGEGERRRSTRAWTSPTACRRTSPSTSS